MSRPIVWGVLAGAGVTAAGWFLLSRAIDKQFETEARSLLDEARPGLQQEIRATLDQEVPPRVRAQLTETLAEFGLTPQTGRQIATILDSAESIGLIGVRR